jgi:exodeoxyribonuclease-3
MRGMKLVSWNVNGIRSVHKKGLFLPFVKAVNADIICLQETKAEQGQSEIDLPDYEEYWNSSKGRKGYSGTAVFTKQKPIAVINEFPEHIAEEYGVDDDGFGHPNEEGRVIAAEFDKFFIVNVYTPNSKPDLARLSLRHEIWDPAFLAYVKELDEIKPVIFCGDMNVAHEEIDLANPKQNEGEHGFTKEEREGMSNFLDAGFIDSYRHFYPDQVGAYTWWTQWSNARARNVGWRIDYFLVSEKLKKKLKGAAIHPDIFGSDHCPVSIEIDL